MRAAFARRRRVLRPMLFLFVVAPFTLLAPGLWAEEPTSIWVMNADGSQPRELVRLEGYDYHRMPRFSHDAKHVAFYAANSEGFAHEVFIANADGSNPRKVAVGDCPDWSGDDKQLLFDMFIGPGFSTQVINVDGTGQQTLGRGSAPRFSPDGDRVALLRKDIPLVIDLVSGEEVHLFGGPLADVGEAIAWSPDGKSLALFGQPIDNVPRQLLIVSAEGAFVQKRVRLDPFRGSVLNFSPDGKQLVFDNAGQIVVVAVEGEAPPRPLPGQKGQQPRPAVFPGRQTYRFCQQPSALERRGQSAAAHAPTSRNQLHATFRGNVARAARRMHRPRQHR